MTQFGNDRNLKDAKGLPKAQRTLQRTSCRCRSKLLLLGWLRTHPFGLDPRMLEMGLASHLMLYYGIWSCHCSQTRFGLLSDAFFGVSNPPSPARQPSMYPQAATYPQY